MFLKTLPNRGVPPRGSVQDRVACEMLIRERRLTLQKSIYLGRIVTAGSMIPEPVFQLWTELFATQVYHENYMPTTIDVKKHAFEGLKSITADDFEENKQKLRNLQKLEATDEALRPSTPKEIEEIKRKLRRHRLKKVTKKKHGSS